MIHHLLAIVSTLALVQAGVPAAFVTKTMLLAATLPNQPVTEDHWSENAIMKRKDYTNSNAANAQQVSCPHLGSGLVPWEQGSTWGGIVPQADGSEITIPANTNVLVGSASFSANTYGIITIPAGSSLVFKDEDITLTVKGIIVNGNLQIGSETCRLTSNIQIILAGKRSDVASFPTDPWVKGIYVTGNLDIHSQQYAPTWTRTARTITAGSNTIFVQDLINWEVGQQIVVTSTEHKDSADFNRNEVREILAVWITPNLGPRVSAIRVTQPFNFAHYGGKEYQAEVGLLSRRIVIRGDDNSDPTPAPVSCTGTGMGVSTYPCPAAAGYGGHIMIQNTGIGRVNGVQLYKMGQTNIMARYPFHLHLVGARGSLSYIKDSCIYVSYYRAVVVHGTNGTLISGNVAYDVTGHAYYLEDGVEENNRFEYNMGSFIRMLGPISEVTGFWGQTRAWVYASPSIIQPSDSAAAAFYIPNPNNEFVGNAASGGWAGYSFPAYLKPSHSFATTNIVPRDRPLGLFDGNTAHSTGFWFGKAGGIYVGGKFEVDPLDANGFRYNAGRIVGSESNPCAITLAVGVGCPPGPNRVAHKFQNSKVFLANRGIMHWGTRAILTNFEALDCNIGANMFGQVGIDKTTITCRSNNVPTKYNGCTSSTWSSCHSRDYMFWQSYAAFEWYDVGQRHIITNSTFRNCRKDWSQCINGLCADTSVFQFVTHSDQFVPEVMQATSNIRYENVDPNNLWRMTVTTSETVSGRLQNWIDMDGSASLTSTTGRKMLGSSRAQNWWKVHSTQCTMSPASMFMWQCQKPAALEMGAITVSPDAAILASVGVSQCPNGGGAYPCNVIGYATHLNRQGLTANGFALTANPRITGPIDQRLGGGWYLRYMAGAPKLVTIGGIQLESGMSTLILAMPYPLGTTFTVSASSNGNVKNYVLASSLDDFKYQASVSGLGDRFFYDSNQQILFVAVVYLTSFSNANPWNRSKQEARSFTFNNITLQESSYNTFISISASCTAADGKFCALNAATFETVPTYVPYVAPGQEMPTIAGQISGVSTSALIGGVMAALAVLCGLIFISRKVQPVPIQVVGKQLSRPLLAKKSEDLKE